MLRDPGIRRAAPPGAEANHEGAGFFVGVLGRVHSRPRLAAVVPGPDPVDADGQQQGIGRLPGFVPPPVSLRIEPGPELGP